MTAVAPQFAPVGTAVLAVGAEVALVAVDVSLITVTVHTIFAKVSAIGTNVCPFFRSSGFIAFPDVLAQFGLVPSQVTPVMVDVALIAVAVYAVLAEVTPVMANISAVATEIASIFSYVVLGKCAQTQQQEQAQAKKASSHRLLSPRILGAGTPDRNPGAMGKFRRSWRL